VDCATTKWSRTESRFADHTVHVTCSIAYMAASTSDAQTSGQTQDDEASLDVNLLKELGKKALIDALNSVRKYHRYRLLMYSLFTGERRQDSRVGLLIGRTTRLNN